MRVRTLELRLIGLVLAGCWVVGGGRVLIGYRPGGPTDVAVGVAALVPALVALAGVVWPPVARGDRGFAAMVWLAAGSLLLLVPSIADVAGQLGGRGAQTLLPSVEAAYPWVLALIGTCLFAGFGIARRRLGSSRRCAGAGSSAACSSRTLLAAASGLVFAAVAMGNELALRDRIATSSRFGPTDLAHDPPSCDGAMGIGTSARLQLHLDGTLDGRPLGLGRPVRRARHVADVRWLAYVATNRELGLARRRDHRRPTPGSACRWPAGDVRRPSEVADATVDLNAFKLALSPEARAAGESRGVGDHRGRAGSPVPDRDRRADVPGRIPAGELARRRRRPRPLARPARLLGLPRRPDRPDRRQRQRRRGRHRARARSRRPSGST